MFVIAVNTVCDFKYEMLVDKNTILDYSVYNTISSFKEDVMDQYRKTARRLMIALSNVDIAYMLSRRISSVSEVELFMMYVLDDDEMHSQKEIAEQLLIPRTTVNAVTKRWVNEGLLTKTPIPGKRREMVISFTDAGREYAKKFFAFLYEAENKAISETLGHYSDEFIDAIEYYSARLKDAFEEESHDDAREMR